MRVPVTRAAPKNQSTDSTPAVDYFRLFEHALDAVLVVDARGGYIAANPAACQLTGYTREEILEMRVGDLAIDEERQLSSERLDLLRRAGWSRRDRMLRRKDGSHVRVEAHAVALGDGSFQTVLRDISDRTKAHEATQRSLDAYSTLVDLCQAGVISAGADGRIRSWNRGAQDLFGHAADEAIGQPITMLIPHRSRNRHLFGFARHVDGPSDPSFYRSFQTQGLRKDGSEVSIEVSVGVGWQHDDRIFTAVMRDITEHIAVTERLNDALQRLTFHFDRMPLACIVWDTEFKAVEWNRAAERVFGYCREEATGRHAFDLIIPADARENAGLMWRRLLDGQTHSHAINANVCSDGRPIICEWFNAPLRDGSGKVRGVASMAMDVSERSAMEARIRDAQRLESLGVLTGGIAHDFNSSLMVILGNTALLRSAEGLPKSALDHIELIEQAGSRAELLIRHLLTYARTGRHNPQPTDLNAVVRDATKLIRSAIGVEHALDIQLASHLPEIVADRSQIEQILINLCLNAKDAMPKGGAIRLSTLVSELTTAGADRSVPYNANPGHYVELLVEDSGCGMDPETVRRMFDPFFTTKPDGHGLGMAAVLGILRQHGAVALVDSEPRGGTRVHVFFVPGERITS